MKTGRVFLTIICVLPQPLSAQEVSGNLQGRGVSVQAEPVADVRVTVAGSSIQGTRGTRTDSQGFFEVLALPAGSYTVRFERIGFRPVVVDSVLVRIGATTNLGLVTIEPQAFELGEIVVSAQRLSIDPASTTIGTNVDAATYDALPVGRDYRSVVDFLPHANTSYYAGDAVNIGGATGLENGYYIDGVNMTPQHFQGSLPVSGAARLGRPHARDLGLESPACLPVQSWAGCRRTGDARLAARRISATAGVARAVPLCGRGRQRQPDQPQSDLWPGAELPATDAGAAGRGIHVLRFRAWLGGSPGSKAGLLEQCSGAVRSEDPLMHVQGVRQPTVGFLRQTCRHNAF